MSFGGWLLICLVVVCYLLWLIWFGIVFDFGICASGTRVGCFVLLEVASVCFGWMGDLCLLFWLWGYLGCMFETLCCWLLLLVLIWILMLVGFWIGCVF